MPEGASAPAATFSSVDLLKSAGKPEVTLAPTQQIDVPASGPDLFLTFTVPVPAGPTRQVGAVGIEASDPQAAHAILIGVDREHVLRKQHPEVLQDGWSTMELPPSLTEQLSPGGQLLLWTPNAPVLQSSPAWQLPGGSDLVLSVHVKTTGRAEKLTFKVMLFGLHRPEPSRRERCCMWVVMRRSRFLPAIRNTL